jgi:hypothetical protein
MPSDRDYGDSPFVSEHALRGVAAVLVLLQCLLLWQATVGAVGHIWTGPAGALVEPFSWIGFRGSSSSSDVPSMTEIVPPEGAQAPVPPIHFRRGENSLRLFTMIATLGTPREVTLEEVRIECFFPIDDDTDAVCRSWKLVGIGGHRPHAGSVTAATQYDPLRDHDEMAEQRREGAGFL